MEFFIILTLIIIKVISDVYSGRNSGSYVRYRKSSDSDSDIDGYTIGPEGYGYYVSGIRVSSDTDDDYKIQFDSNTFNDHERRYDWD